MNKLFDIRQIILISILLLAAFLRLWNLENVPPSTSMDEASIGYNAYSVSKIGVDEYGNFPIISQRGYDDWRRSTYLFLVVPFVKLLGLNVVAVRLPAIILSILTVWATYYIVLYLFSKRSAFSLNIALLTSFLLAISPWHIYISRLGHESNACLSFLVFGVLFFLQGEKNKIKYLFSMVFFTLSMISYYSGQVFIPLFVLGIFFIFRKNLLKVASSDKKILIPFFFFLILLVPIIWAIFSPQALIRFQGTSTFKPEAHSQMYSQRVQMWNKAVQNNDIFGTIFYDRHLFPIQVLIDGYTSHFNPKWLFSNFSAEPHKVPNTGLLYLWEIPFIIIGMIFLVFGRIFDPKMKKLIFLWFFLAPLPASIATQTPHAMRSYNVLPTWQIFTALGIFFIYGRLKNTKLKKIAIGLFFITIFASVYYLFIQYFYVFPKTQSSSFQYALSKTIPFVLKNEKSYSKIIFSNQENLYQSYMLFLFYSKYDPSLYQKQGGTKSGGFAETHLFGKYVFRPFDSNKEKKGGSVLYVGNLNDFPKNLVGIKEFSNLDNKNVIKIVY